MRGITVILPVRNMADTLSEQLAALARQQPGTIAEVMLIDHASTDDTRSVAESWIGRLANLTILSADPKLGIGAVRDVGVAAASGDLIAFVDADDVVGDAWSTEMLEALLHHRLVAGHIDHTRLNPRSQYDEVEWEDAPLRYGFLRAGIGANMGIHRDLLADIGGFDQGLHRGEDLDVFWKSQLRGEALYYARDAVVHRRLRSGAWAIAYQHYHYGRSAPLVFRRYRQFGLRRRPTRDVIYDLAMIIVRLPTIIDPAARRRWATWSGRSIGFVVGSITARTIYL
jgi:glycosyltransferase involved in cell wall biosynthesis